VSLVKGVKADTRFQFELGQLFRDGSDYLNTLGFVKRRSVNHKSKVSEPCRYFVLIPYLIQAENRKTNAPLVSRGDKGSQQKNRNTQNCAGDSLGRGMVL